jgi:hypothetical protein
MALFREAVRQRVLVAADVVDYLDVSPDALITSGTRPVNNEDV